MDYATSHIFFTTSLGIFTVALFVLSLVDRRVVGARWLAASTLADFFKTMLQGLNGHLPRFITVCVANEINVLVFVLMFLGLHWFVERKPFREWWWAVPIVCAMAIYPWMFLARLRLWSFAAISLPVIGLCAAAVQMLLRQKNERFVLAARLTAALLMIHIGMLLFRVSLSMKGLSASSSTRPWADPNWMYSMLLIMLVCFCVLLMYVLFTVIEMQSHIEHAAGADALTGAVNRRALGKYASREMEESERLGTSLAIMQIDLDHFKSINDTYGHPAGDAVLCAFVDLARDHLRSCDVIARTGGEEFVLLLPNMNAAEAAQVADRLRHSFEQMRVHYDGRMIVATASFGVTERQRGESLAMMMKRADALLYRAKSEGRNRVVLEDAALPKRPVLVEMPQQRVDGKSA